MTQPAPNGALNVDSNRVIAVLQARLSEVHLQNAILEVALNTAQASLEVTTAALRQLQEAAPGEPGADDSR